MSPCGDTPFPKRALTIVKGDFTCARLFANPWVRRRMWNLSPVFLAKGLGLALSECLLLAAHPAATRRPGESVHWKEPVPHEQRPAGTVTRGPEIVLSLSPPLPPPHAHALGGRLLHTCSSSRLCCSCWRRRFPAKPRTDGLRTVSTLSLRRGPLPAPTEQRALGFLSGPPTRGGEKTCLTLDSDDKHFKKERLTWQDHAQL